MPQKKKITEKADKRRRAKVTVGHDAYGAPIVRYASGRTQRELDDNKDALKRKYIGGVADVNFETMFDAALEEWYTVYKKPNVGISSQKSYEANMNNHILPAFGGRQIKAIRAVELQKFMNDHSHMGRSTVGNIACILRGVFGSAQKEGIIQIDPSIGLSEKHAPTEEKRALTDPEVTATLEIIDTHPEGLLIAILYYTGMRRGEALGLQWNDIDFNDRWIHVKRDIDFSTNAPGEVKTDRSLRAIPIPDELHKILNAARGIGGNYVLQAPRSHDFISASTYKRLWDRLMTAMYQIDSSIECEELPASKKNRQREEERQKKAKTKGEMPDPEYGSILTAHYFRHNYASLLYDADIDVVTAASYLGHSVTVMLQIYTHLSDSKKKGGAKLVNQAFNLKGCQKVARTEK